jgi:XTP/dITP diphosphohydrolase
MKVVIASGNKGKIKEFKTLLPDFEIITYKEILGDIEIIEDADTFKGNAIKKAKTIYDALPKDEKYLVISDDSGITVPALNNEPNIYSARYAGENATDVDNNYKLISRLNGEGIEKTDAFYTACIAIVFKDQIYTTHGWMHGEVQNKSIGNGGFGYDPLFTPNGFDETLGTLDGEIKKKLSHRSHAIDRAMKIIKVIV